MRIKTQTTNLVLIALALAFALFTLAPVQAQVTNPQTGAAGLTGRVPTDPPQTAATISFPTNNQVFEDVPIEVTGLCEAGLTVKLFKNEVFAGAVLCESNGTYSITIDLFSGTNELVARVFDDLDQPGPDSNIVTVTYNDDGGVGSDIDRVTITTNYAKRGANPGSRLTWPLQITGGSAPYAISVDWGDLSDDLLTQISAGDFEIEHVYDSPGTYKIIIKVTDSLGRSSFLQLIGVANGPILSRVEFIENADGSTSEVRTITKESIIIWPLYVMLFLIVSTFWLGRRYENKQIKRRAGGDYFR